jgi:predicted ribosomally synthesized peptide with SipW-like signal peptide
MTDDQPTISRRKALAALGTIGAASAGAGLGTTAYFSDQETFENNRLAAGTLDLKVGWQEHYSNWLDDDYGADPPLGAETRFARMPDEGETPDVSLPPGDDQTNARPIELVFVDDADGDDEGGFDSRPDEADGGRQFLRNTRRQAVNGGLYGGPASLCDTDADVPDGRALIEVADLKPGDFGAALFRLELCDNPGFLWLNGGLDAASENGRTEPERDDPDEERGTVELLDEVQVAYAVGETNDIAAGSDANPLPLPANGTLENQTTLRAFLNDLASADGIGLAGDLPAEDGGGTGRNCFAGGTSHYVSVVWWLPIDHGNQVQSDTARFDLGFYAEQCRHNEAGAMNADQPDRQGPITIGDQTAGAPP